jgi:hypothetical protein
MNLNYFENEPEILAISVSSSDPDTKVGNKTRNNYKTQKFYS